VQYPNRGLASSSACKVSGICAADALFMGPRGHCPLLQLGLRMRTTSSHSSPLEPMGKTVVVFKILQCRSGAVGGPP
jgi:hypothetical protein